MHPITIKTKLGKSKIFLAEGLCNAISYLPETKIAIITDINVDKFYGDDFPANAGKIIIGTGENIKTLDTVRSIYDRFLELNIDRKSFIIGIGGGIVCDIAGFVASTYLRGLRFGFVSSTLLSQVDASIGGKNGVNFHGYKNLIGTFNQPEWVICDLDMLETLPKEEFRAAFGEIIKHACIANYDMFEFLEANYQKALNKDHATLQKLIHSSLEIKSKVVQKDEKEKGLRRILNFGHTIGHAIEKIDNSIIHGNAISIGMVVAAKLSATKGLISGNDAERIEKLIENFGLPTKLDMNKDDIFESVKKDKKRENDYINFVLIDKIGNAITQAIGLNDFKNVIYDLC
jgi:3-dehydroquinate synthase